MIAYNLIIPVAVLYIFYYATATFTNDDIRNHLGTKTPYRFKYNKNDSKIKFPGCKASKIWMIMRHGTRLPSAKDILGMHSTLKPLSYEIILRHKNGKGLLTQEQLKELETWSFHEESLNEKHLVREGRDEMFHLAKRMQNRFPNIIKHKYNERNYMFRYTPTERAQESAKYFTMGLFDKKIAQNVTMTETSKGDSVLRFYKYCDKWLMQVKNNPLTYAEQKKLGHSPLMNQTLEIISQRLGLEDNISLAEANLMYKACAFETAWWKDYSAPWCFAFDKNTIKVLEYYHDLKHYWLDGYGHDLSYHSACSSVKNMFEHLTSKNAPNATFLFAHSGTLLKIIAHMNLYRPKAPLKGDAILPNNVWRMSDINCFASNLAFVLFECEDGDHLLSLHQERIVKLPMCDKELCPLKHLTESFHDTIYNCDHSVICKVSRKDEL